MKLKTINQIAVIFAIVVSTYFLGAFYSTSFNIANWSDLTRALFVFLTPTIVAGTLVILNIDNL